MIISAKNKNNFKKKICENCFVKNYCNKLIYNKITLTQIKEIIII